MRISKFVCSICLVILCASFTQAGPIPTRMMMHTTIHTMHAQSPVYTQSEPINITSNEDLVSFGLNGSGTKNDPYTISNLNITTDTHCIRIENVSLYLLIESCYFNSISHFRYQTHNDSIGLGIYLNNVTNCRIEECVITAKYHGIVVFGSQNCSLYHNTIYACMWDGIRISDSPNFMIRSNIVENVDTGVHVQNSDKLVVLGNSIEDCEGGIYLKQCDFLNVTSNYVSDNEDGLFIHYCEYFAIVDLQARNNNNGIILDQSYNGSIIHSNAVRCDSNGFYLQMIADVNITDCSFSSNTWGARLSLSYDVILDSNTCYSNEIIGIYFHSSHDCNLTNNDIQYNGGYGIYVDWDSYNMTIYDNTFYHEDGMDAIDHSQGTVWDDGNGTGNRWTDWHGLGIYNVPGDGENVDRYPSGWVVYPLATYFATFAFIAVVIVFILYKSKALIAGRLKSIKLHSMKLLR